MNIVISADMEGVSGVTSPADVNPGSAGWNHFRKIMTEEVNAAVDGFFELLDYEKEISIKLPADPKLTLKQQLEENDAGNIEKFNHETENDFIFQDSIQIKQMSFSYNNNVCFFSIKEKT